MSTASQINNRSSLSRRALCLSACLAALFVVSPSVSFSSECDVCIFGEPFYYTAGLLLQRELEAAGLSAKTAISRIPGPEARRIADWKSIGENLVREHKPRMVVAMLGTHETRPLKVKGVSRPVGSPEWEKAFSEDVTEVINSLLGQGAELLVWAGLPPMRDENVNKMVNTINRALEDVCCSKSGVLYVDTAMHLSKDTGEYSPYIIGENGLPVHVRAADGDNFSMDGARILAEAIDSALRNETGAFAAHNGGIVK